MTNTDLQALLGRDDSELVDAIKSEIHEHIAKLHARGDQFYGYAILPGEFYQIHDLVVAFNRESDIAPENVADSYYRYSVDEWSNYEHSEFPKSSAIIDLCNAKFKELHLNDNPDDYAMDDWEIAHATKLLAAILTAMNELRHDSLIGGDESFAVIWIPDSDLDIMKQSAKTLNSSGVYETFIKEFGD
ncbi:DUF4303 domain-containing protein [Tychonema sp. LEGE 07199]|uniref:DUF4303 domain-containing protein n=1 Tax=unclassified Tychonema TaxID=2642144 RepID=UPI00188001F2|nr:MULTISPECIES: DUF4303 domain-containing protein [unclassified Tychonema]MBE9119771.1 DUF4303 domain-containing protein [Tychonema sp. LEGE 07199]MBE9132144.1 DUF4303 domain-containing protein [Tychonema sp. LEGE 07196]